MKTGLQKLVEWWETRASGMTARPAEMRVAMEIIDKARSLLKEEQSDYEHAKELEESMSAAIKEKIAEQSHTEQGLVEIECPHCYKGTITIYDSPLPVNMSMENAIGATALGVAVVKAISRHTAKVDKDKGVEPLAVLADRKGYWITQIEKFAPALPVPREWYISIGTEGIDEMGCPNGNIFTGDTYAACELKARQYLEQLNDREEKI